MSVNPPDRFDDLPILDELRERLGAAYRASRARPQRAARLRAHRWRASVVVAVLVLGGAAGALAAVGAFQTGSPYGNDGPQTPHAFGGVVSHDSVALLAIDVPDPQGGPPWGLRMSRTTRGLVCVSVGRVDHGTIGALGIDDAFGDDGRFHPLSPKAVGGQAQEGCTALDAHGHGFVSVTDEAVPASGLLGSCHGDAGSLFTGLPNGRAAHFIQSLAARDPGPICPPADLRNIYYGLLGPEAVSVTYPGPDGRPVTERTVGPDGAYLVLGPPRGATCEPGGGCQSGNSSGAGLSQGFITSVAYRNGHVCPVATLERPEERSAARYQDQLAARFPAVALARRRGSLTPAQRAAFAAETRSPAYRAFRRAHGRELRASLRDPRCPLVGYTARQSEDVGAADVSTPVTVTVLGRGACLNFNGSRDCAAAEEVGIVVNFRARVAVANGTSHYEVSMRFTPTGPCSSARGGGQSVPTESNLRAGQLVHVPMFVADCPTRISGDVVYNAAHNRGYRPEKLPGVPAGIDGVLVGTFHLRVR